MTDNLLKQIGFPATAAKERVESREVLESKLKRAKEATSITERSTKKYPQGKTNLPLTEKSRENEIILHVRRSVDVVRKTSSPEGKYVIDRIIFHFINEDENHRHVNVGERLYRVR